MAVVSTAKLGVELCVDDHVYLLHEGDTVEDLIYMSGTTEKSISGVVRVLNASTKANNTIPSDCPPEPYAHRYISVFAMVIDSSEENDAELTRINTSSICSIGTINGAKQAATLNGVLYADVQEAVNALVAEGKGTLRILDSATIGKVTLPAGCDVTIEGNGSTVITGNIVCTATNDEAVSSTLTLKNLTLQGDGVNQYGIHSQNQTADNQMELNLYLENVTLKGFPKKGLYLTNVKLLGLKNCTLTDVASGDMNTPNTYGDYGIDLNLVAVKGTIVNIENCAFKDRCGSKAAIKVTARGCPSDQDAGDVPVGGDAMAQVRSVSIKGCSFVLDRTPAGDEDEDAVDFRIGTNTKTTGKEAENYTGAYAVDIRSNSTAVIVNLAYQDDAPGSTVTVPINGIATKAAEDATLTVVGR